MRQHKRANATRGCTVRFPSRAAFVAIAGSSAVQASASLVIFFANRITRDPDVGVSAENFCNRRILQAISDQPSFRGGWGAGADLPPRASTWQSALPATFGFCSVPLGLPVATDRRLLACQRCCALALQTNERRFASARSVGERHAPARARWSTTALLGKVASRATGYPLRSAIRAAVHLRVEPVGRLRREPPPLTPPPCREMGGFSGCGVDRFALAFTGLQSSPSARFARSVILGPGSSGALSAVRSSHARGLARAAGHARKRVADAGELAAAGRAKTLAQCARLEPTRADVW